MMTKLLLILHSIPLLIISSHLHHSQYLGCTFHLAGDPPKSLFKREESCRPLGIQKAGAASRDHHLQDRAFRLPHPCRHLLRRLGATHPEYRAHHGQSRLRLGGEE